MAMLLPDWPAAARVHARCSLRDGGVSAPPYDSLNLGDHVGDTPEAVAENRRRFGAQLHARPVFMKQVHGWQVAKLDVRTPDDIEADACWTDEAGVACTIMVADCLPVLLTDASGAQVGAAHCGWRGLAGAQGQGVLEALHAAMALQGDALAWLGPCIGPEAFEVGAEVRDAFVATDTGAASLFRPHAPGKFLADLPGLARRRLAALGITRIYGNDGSPAWCTVSNPSRFFSHRRDRISGRFAASIWLG
jgi:polyphenol oxidase